MTTTPVPVSMTSVSRSSRQEAAVTAPMTRQAIHGELKRGCSAVTARFTTPGQTRSRPLA